MWLRNITFRYNGQVFSLHQSRLSEGGYLEITSKAETLRFEEALGAIRSLGTTSNISKDVRDVTTFFIDKEAGIETLKGKEKTLMDILTTAARIEDILLIETNLQSTRRENESSEGQLIALKKAPSYFPIWSPSPIQRAWPRPRKLSHLICYCENFSRSLRYGPTKPSMPFPVFGPASR